MRHEDLERELGRDDLPRGDWALFSIAKSAHEIALELKRIREILVSAVQIRNLELEIMPKTIVVGAVSNAVLKATGTDGNPYNLTSADTIALSAAVAGDVTFGTPTFPGDGTAVIPVTGVNADSGDAISAVVDGITSNSDTLTITSPVVSVASLSLELQ